MKGFLIVLGILAALFLGWQLYRSFLAEKVEEQPYESLQAEGKKEIRYYPEAIMAQVSQKGPYKDMLYGGFRQLAGYIFGGNADGKKIAMTAPVIMDYAEGESAGEVSFVMPAEYSLDDLPNPNTSGIRLFTSEPRYKAAIRFGGFAGENKMLRKRKELVQWLRQQGIPHDGNFEYRYYNDPFTLFNRRNEVLVGVSEYTSQ